MNKRSSRAEIYNTYRKYVQKKDTRTMDQLCSSSKDGFGLQVQQKFAKDLIANSDNWDRIMLYHGIGSGKTCTSITMAEQWLLDNPTGRVSVILPARLKTNFLDELISPCGFEKYISASDFDIYTDSKTPASVKSKIRGEFMKKITQHYEIMSFEKFHLDAKKAKNLDEWIDNYTNNHLVIIDEIHNLINVNYKQRVYDEMKTLKRISPKVSGARTMLFRYFMEHVTNCKVILMTATPIFDNIKQFKELTSIMSGVNKKSIRTLTDAINNLRGLVSYYPGTSEKAFPTKTYIPSDVPLSNTQKVRFEDILFQGDDEDDQTKEAYMSKQRQASIATVPLGKKFSIKTVLSNLPEYSPKVLKILNSIESDKIGKHLIFSNFVANGLHIIEQALIKRGWVNIKDVKTNTNDYKVYALWDGSLKDTEKQFTKNVANSKSNIDGKYLRVILGSPSIKEGVSFKHIQHLHMLDPVWNNSAKIQIEGRAVRFCSHSDIPKDHPKLSRNVNIHLYKSTGLPPINIGNVRMTCDEKLYDVIIPKKLKDVSIAEKALKKVAIDYHLFRNMYEEKEVFNSPKIGSKNSAISIDDDNVFDENNRKNAIDKEKSTCPKARRPDEEGNCPPNTINRLNKKGDVCCYKVGRTRVKK